MIKFIAGKYGVPNLVDSGNYWYNTESINLFWNQIDYIIIFFTKGELTWSETYLNTAKIWFQDRQYWYCFNFGYIRYNIDKVQNSVVKRIKKLTCNTLKYVLLYQPFRMDFPLPKGWVNWNSLIYLSYETRNTWPNGRAKSNPKDWYTAVYRFRHQLTSLHFFSINFDIKYGVSNVQFLF